MHSGLFETADRLPVYSAGDAFHQKEGLLFDASHQVMRSRSLNGGIAFVGGIPVPDGVIVPGDDVEDIPEFKVVQPVIEAHEVCRDRDIRTAGADGSLFPGAEVHGAVGNKTAPVQHQSVNGKLAFRNRRLNLVKGTVGMAPEGSPPLFVEGFDRTVFLFQPVPEFLLA